MARNFTAEIKEREDGQPCYLWLNTDEDIGLGRRAVLLNLPAGTGYEEARRLRNALHELVSTIRISSS